MLTVIYDDQNIQRLMDSGPVMESLALIVLDFFFFPGKFRRDLQLDQNLSKDKSEGDYLP